MNFFMRRLESWAEMARRGFRRLGLGNAPRRVSIGLLMYDHRIPRAWNKHQIESSFNRFWGDSKVSSRDILNFIFEFPDCGIKCAVTVFKIHILACATNGLFSRRTFKT
jgi:hypothetical protein